MGKYRLIAADLDGTLLDNTYTVAPELLAHVNRSRAGGAELVVATGRLFPAALPFIRDLGVSLPVIASNGAVVKDPVTEELIYQMSLPRELAVEVLRYTDGYRVQRFVPVRDNFYTDAPEDVSRKYSEALKIRFERREPLEDVVTEDPTMVVIRGREDDIAGLTEKLRAAFGNKVYLANSKPFFIDINHPEVSKGAALLNVCRRLGIEPAEVIAIGDGWNDLEMFEVAGIGAAVANAPDSLKEQADYVCENETYMGVIEVIKRFVLGTL